MPLFGVGRREPLNRNAAHERPIGRGHPQHVPRPAGPFFGGGAAPRPIPHGHVHHVPYHAPRPLPQVVFAPTPSPVYVPRPVSIFHRPFFRPWPRVTVMTGYWSPITALAITALALGIAVAIVASGIGLGLFAVGLAATIFGLYLRAMKNKNQQ